MPLLVRTPEKVLRKTRRNLYLIQFHQALNDLGGMVHFHYERGVDDIPDYPGRRDILAWFKRECPEVELENLGPWEWSGAIEGGIGILLRVAFDKKSLAKYCAAWENPDGSSKDPRWSCYIYPYAQYLKNAPEIRRIHKATMDSI